MICTKQIAENYSLAKDLETLYKTNRQEFIRHVKPKIRFAYSVNGKTKSKFIRKFDGEYNLIEANPNDVITHTDGRHRTALAADCGLRKMLFVIDNDGLNNLTSRKLFNHKLIISGG